MLPVFLCHLIAKMGIYAKKRSLAPFSNLGIPHNLLSGFYLLRSLLNQILGSCDSILPKGEGKKADKLANLLKKSTRFRLTFREFLLNLRVGKRWGCFPEI